jgi:hypothetical protein
MQGLFEIVRITDKLGNDRTDGRYPARIGQKGELYLFGCDRAACFEYEDGHGTLVTSLVENIEAANGIHKVTTLNSVYYFKELY